MALDHFFDAIDAVLCWEVRATGKIQDCGDAPTTGGLYESAKKERRVIPILCVKPLFTAKPA